MSLNKKQMVREIGRRTRLKNRDVQVVIETLVALWTEELMNGGRIELENFMVLEVKAIEPGTQRGTLLPASRPEAGPRVLRRVMVKISKRLKSTLVR